MQAVLTLLEAEYINMFNALGKIFIFQNSIDTIINVAPTETSWD